MNTIYQSQKSARDLESRLAGFDREASEAMRARRRNGLLNRLFPNEQEKMAVAHQLQTVKSEYEFRRNAIELLRKTQLRAMDDMLKDYLVKYEAPRKRELSEFILEQKVQMEDRLMELTEAFNDRVTLAWENADRQKIPALRERSLIHVDNVIQSYHDMVERLQNQFSELVEETVRKYGV